MGVRTIVQAAAKGNNTTDGTTCHLTFGAAPTNGNLLVAFMLLDAANGAASANTNWHIETDQDNTDGVRTTVMYKYCGAGESTTQQPITNGEQFWGLVIYEIAGVSGTWATDRVATHMNPIPIQSGAGGTICGGGGFTTANNTELVIGGFLTGGTTTGDGVTISGGLGSGTTDASNEGAGSGVSPNIPIFGAGHSWVVASSGTAFNQTVAGVHGNGLFYAVVELTSSSGTETSTASLALSGIGYGAHASTNRAAGGLALTGISYGATAQDRRVGQATLALNHVSFNAAVQAVVTGTGTLALSGVAIRAGVIDLGPAGSGAVHFATFGA